MIRTFTNRLRRLAIAVTVLASAGLSTSAALAQHEEHGDHDGQAMEGGMPPMGRPAEMDQISFMQGSWQVEMNIRMAPDADWMTSEAHAETEPVLDGCAQRMTFTGNVMGMPFEGIDHSTYNRDTKRFESVWIDSMGARMNVMHGNFNDHGQLVLTGESIENGMKMKTRTISTRIDENTVTWTMEMSTDGDTWFQNMKMTYVRTD